jgi:hypothetical protein
MELKLAKFHCPLERLELTRGFVHQLSCHSARVNALFVKVDAHIFDSFFRRKLFNFSWSAFFFSAL